MNYWAIKRAPFLGSDPEVFLTSGGKLLPAWKVLPDKKTPVKHFVKYGACLGVAAYWDGFQAEFRTSPQGCIAYATDQVRYGLQLVLDQARKTVPNTKLSIQSVFKVTYASLKKESDEHVVLGCDPSINAYYMAGDFVGDSRRFIYRPAGGHIHLGGVALGNEMFPDREKAAQPVIKALDAILGVWSVGAAASFDNPVRRKHYGLAGEYRLPEWGLEYRTLSNFWITQPAITNLVFDLARAILNFQEQGQMPRWLAHEMEVVEIINQCDVKRARKLLELNKDVFKEIVQKSTSATSNGHGQQALNVGLNGIESVVKDPEAFEDNWALNDTEWCDHSDYKYHNWKNASSALALGERL